MPFSAKEMRLIKETNHILYGILTQFTITFFHSGKNCANTPLMEVVVV
jgi:hypothetical protein